ncbi:hypothetical protein NB607_15235 [Vibrio alginolyticus]|uniref:hypothetical protein n=1 Tax=Vibrio alginolyticus TaxID=663 RepID=UPI00215BC740|nr:hypothetical protein [Vibrio alginolyticus]MCS0038322.1 hypothetical protein [Vibrio alginolyticus]
MDFTISPVTKEVEINTNKISSEFFSIKSKSPDPLYIKLYVKEIIDPKLETEKERELEGNSEIILNPSKLIVYPFETKRVRTFIQLGEKKSESIYKIYFEQVNDFEYYDNYPQSEPNGLMPVRYILSSLIKAIPTSSKAIISNQKGVISNSGSRHIRIVEKCVSAEKGNCNWEKISSYFHLYPMNEISWEDDLLRNAQSIKYTIPPQHYEYTLSR